MVEKDGKSFKGVSKTKKKKHKKRLSFITQLKIEFLLPITGCRKMLGKIPVIIRALTTLHQLCLLPTKI